MYRVSVALVVAILIASAAVLSGQDPPPPSDAKVAALEAKIKALEAQIAKPAQTTDELVASTKQVFTDSHDKAKVSPFAQACKAARGVFVTSIDPTGKMLLTCEWFDR